MDIQALEHIREFQGSEYGVSDKKYKELKADGFLMERSYIKGNRKEGKKRLHIIST